MKIIIRIQISLIFSALFISCSGYSLTEQNLILEKDISKKVFLKQSGPYYFTNGVFNVLEKNTENKHYEVIITNLRSPIFGGPYYYAFCNDSLIYWGYPYMFTRHKDKIIREIGEETMQITKKIFDIKDDEKIIK